MSLELHPARHVVGDDVTISRVRAEAQDTVDQVGCRQGQDRNASAREPRPTSRALRCA